MGYLCISILVVIFGKALACQEECLQINGNRIVGDSLVRVHLNEDVIAPTGTVLVLDSTIREPDQINTCINKTSVQGTTVHCWPGDDILYDRNGVLVSEFEITHYSKNNSIFTWWSKKTGLLGETMVVIPDNPNYFTVFGKTSKATSVVFNLDNGPSIDVALLHKSDNGLIEVYSYQPQEGLMLCCSTRVPDIIPSHGGLLYMTTFQDVHCSLVGSYTLIATRAYEEAVVRTFDFKLENKGADTVIVTVSYKPYSFGYHAELVCTSLHDLILVTWTFNGQTLKNDSKYKITNTGRNQSILSISEVSGEDIGSYTCQIQSECYVAHSSVYVSYVSNAESIYTSIIAKGVTPYNFVLLRCLVTGHIISMAWMYNGRVIQNDSKHNVTRVQNNVLELLINHLDQTYIGQYLCRCLTMRNVTLQSVVDIYPIDQPLTDIASGTRPTTTSSGVTDTSSTAFYNALVVVCVAYSLTLLLMTVYVTVRKWKQDRRKYNHISTDSLSRV